jgi:hypothetical protein
MLIEQTSYPQTASNNNNNTLVFIICILIPILIGISKTQCNTSILKTPKVL